MNTQNAHLYLPLVKALADGKNIQIRIGDEWQDREDVNFGVNPNAYRIKPWEPSRSIPGFRPLRDGEEWATLGGWEERQFNAQSPIRPLLKGEPYKGDDCITWDADHITTLRPLPEPPKRIPLGPEDWMKDGPWWIRQIGTSPVKMVVELRDVGLSSGHNHELTNHSVTEHFERSNDGINWTPCSKEA